MKIKLDENNFIVAATTDENCIDCQLCGGTHICEGIIIEENLNTFVLYMYGVPINKYIDGQIIQTTNDLDYVGTSWEDIYYASMEDFYKDNGRLPNYGVSLDLSKKCQIQKINLACTNDIYEGFPSKAFDGETEKVYDFYEQEQTNMNGMLNLINANVPIPIYWKAQSELNSYAWTKEQMKALCIDAYSIKLQKVLKYHILRQQIVDSTTREQVEAIEYIP